MGPMTMATKTLLAAGLLALLMVGVGQAQQATDAPAQITMGNGEANAIATEGLARIGGETAFSQVRIDGAAISTLRATSTAIQFPEVMIEQPGWLVLHPVIDGKPDGDIVSGFTYLDAGKNTDVAVRIDHPAEPGDRFLVMLHSDANRDRVFDFVFVEDGINVEDRAVFEGTRMIAHLITVPN